MQRKKRKIDRWITLGRVLAPHGVKGWVKIYSETRPLEAIFEYPQWFLGEDRQPYEVVEHGRSGKAFMALLANKSTDAVLEPDRDTALLLRGLEVAVPRSELPEPEDGTNYWSDMLGLQVVNLQGESLGTVTEFLESAAHDVLVTKEGEQQRLIPFVRDEIVIEVNLAKGEIQVDWSADWE